MRGQPILQSSAVGRDREDRKQESIMGVIEIILIGFIGINAALGVLSVFTLAR
ncbi:hypothetical protein [Hyphococcus sp.]|uniref:hypothetical protein n=1 Tax=Hyphococcus sp. TaxID=2038636 RepID=UPI002082B9CB|nr:MAG: hypothetical protein DHS20C04_14940 [Marinicaulis sp.]